MALEFSLKRREESPLETVNAKIRKVLNGICHDAGDGVAVGKFFVQEDLLELEPQALGTLMFKLDGLAESPRTVLVSVYLLCLRAANLLPATRLSLAATYNSSAASAALAWLGRSADRIHKTVSPVGCVGAISPGTTSLITCVLRGNVYNTARTEVFSLSVPKELYVSLSPPGRSAEMAYVYFVIVYGYNNSRAEPSIYLMTSTVAHRVTLVNLLRHRFSSERFAYLNQCITRPGDIRACLGSVQRIGTCSAEGVSFGILHHKSVKIPVAKVQEVFLDIEDPFEFV